MAVYKKKERWYIDYYLPSGLRKREVVTIPGVDPAQINREDAKKALSIRKAEMAQGKFDIAQTEKKVPFAKLVEKFLEYSKTNKKSYTRDITSSRVLLDYFGGKTVQQINAWHIEQYKSKRQKDITRFGKPPAKATINRELAFLKTMFSMAIKWNITNANPVKDIKLFKENNTNLRILSNEEFQQLYDESSESLKSFLLIMVNTGMRPNEIFKLKWNDVNMKQKYINITDSKNGDPRIIPINDVLYLCLTSLDKANEYVLTHSDGRQVKSNKGAFCSALKKSGIDHCRIYDLRHTFASNLVMAGVDIVTVKELLGHKDITMTMRYSHPTPEHKKQALNKLNMGAIDTYLDTNSNLYPVISDVTT